MKCAILMLGFVSYTPAICRNMENFSIAPENPFTLLCCFSKSPPSPKPSFLLLSSLTFHKFILEFCYTSENVTHMSGSYNSSTLDIKSPSFPTSLLSSSHTAQSVSPFYCSWLHFSGGFFRNCNKQLVLNLQLN